MRRRRLIAGGLQERGAELTSGGNKLIVLRRYFSIDSIHASGAQRLLQSIILTPQLPQGVAVRSQGQKHVVP